MSEAVGIRLQRSGRVFYFDPVSIDMEVGDQVVVETETGLEVGWVVIAPRQMLYNELPERLPPVLRKATPEDLARKEPLQRSS